MLANVNEDQEVNVDFHKILIPGILCKVSFQLFLSYILPIREFKVELYRQRLPGYQGDKESYVYLGMTMRNVMRGVYGIDIFPEGKFEFEFTDEGSLKRSID